MANHLLVQFGPPLWLITGNLGRAATQVMILWVFASRGGAASAGEFALALAFLSPLFMLAELALRNVYQTLHERPAFRIFFALRLASAGVAAMVGILAASVSSLLPPVSVVAALTCMKFFDSLIDMFKARLMAEGRIKETAAYTWYNVALTALLVLVVFALSIQAVWAVVASAGASAVTVFTLWRLLLREPDRWIPRALDVRPIVAAGLRLGIAQTIISAVAYVPTYYLSLSANEATIGVFAACQYFVTMTNLVFASIQQITLRSLRAAWLSTNRARLMRDVRRHFLGTIGLAALLGLLFTAALPIVLPIIFGEEFEVSLVDVIPLGIAMVALGADSIAAAILMAANRYIHRLMVAVVSLGAAIGAAAALGTPGTVAKASLIMAAAYLVRAIATAAWLRDI